MMNLVVVGSLAIDRLWIPFRDEPFDVLGGSALYSSIAASKFDVRVGVVGVVGRDRSVEFYDVFREVGIDVSGIEEREGKTFFWEGKYLADMNRRQTVSLDLGVFADFVPKVPSVYKGCDCLFLANISPKLQWQVLEAIEPKIVAMDTMDHWIVSFKDELIELLSKVDIFFLNEEESFLLSGKSNVFRAGECILRHMPSDGIVVIKRGDSGAVLMNREIRRFIPSYPLEEVKDPTGAGDCFAGGFLSAYIISKRIGNDFEDVIASALASGTVIASFCVEDVGIYTLRSVRSKEVLKRAGELFSYLCRRWDLNPHVRKDTWS